MAPSLLAMNAQYCHSEDLAGFATAGCATFAAEMEGRNGAAWGNISDAAPRLGLAVTPTARLDPIHGAGRDVIRVTLQSQPRPSCVPNDRARGEQTCRTKGSSGEKTGEGTAPGKEVNPSAALTLGLDRRETSKPSLILRADRQQGVSKGWGPLARL